MVCFQDLFVLSAADLERVGDKAQTLARLRHWGLPVLPTWVLGSESWQAMLSGVGEWQSQPTDAIALQQFAQQLRQQVQLHSVDLDSSSVQLSLPLMLRSSLGLLDDQNRCLPPPPIFQGLLAGQICTVQPALEHLKQTWHQALSAQNLRVWQHHGLSLNRLNLALIAQPLVSAAFSGTLVLAGDRAWLEIVEGLGIVLSQGEAIPACCHFDGNQHSWQTGYQERSTSLDPVSGDISWQWCPEPTLRSPLEPSQVDWLLQLGREVQQRLGETVRLEWVLEPAAGLNFVITQAAAWQSPELTGTVVETVDSPERLLTPDLPSIQVAIRGIPAAMGRRLAQALVVKAADQMPAQLPSDCIIVAQDIQPDLFSRAVDLVGIVIEEGSATCHAAILARERGIPAVVGAPHATSLVETGDTLWLDGDQGMVYLMSETPPTWRQTDRLRQPPAAVLNRLQTHTQIMVNLSRAARLADYVAAIDGVGLVRSEWLLLDGLEGRHPQHWIEAGQTRDLEAVIVERLRPILAACPDKPVRYRSLDLRSHEWSQLQGSPSREVNPMLGLRGTFSYQQDPRLFQTELAALRTLQRQGYDQLELILPFVRTVTEVQACQHLIKQAGLPEVELFRLWMMAEVPSVLFLLPAYAKAGVQGIAIGTNDLTQLLLAVDREQPLLANSYDERHPAVLAALQHLIRQAKAQGIDCSLCGQAPVRFPELIDLLVAWGIDSICVEPAAIAATREAVLAAES